MLEKEVTREARGILIRMGNDKVAALFYRFGVGIE